MENSDQSQLALIQQRLALAERNVTVLLKQRDYFLTQLTESSVDHLVAVDANKALAKSLETFQQETSRLKLSERALVVNNESLENYVALLLKYLSHLNNSLQVSGVTILTELSDIKSFLRELRVEENKKQIELDAKKFEDKAREILRNVETSEDETLVDPGNQKEEMFDQQTDFIPEQKAPA